MGFLDKLRKRPNAPAALAETVRCPACGEVNAASVVLCSICRGALPARGEQQVRAAASPR